MAQLRCVLTCGYGRSVLVSVLSNVFTIADLQVQQAAWVWRALRIYAADADFVNSLTAVVHQTESCETTDMFERKAAKSALHRLVRLE